jgi:hypothetical protein
MFGVLEIFVCAHRPLPRWQAAMIAECGRA